ICNIGGFFRGPLIIRQSRAALRLDARETCSTFRTPKRNFLCDPYCTNNAAKTERSLDAFEPGAPALAGTIVSDGLSSGGEMGYSYGPGLGFAPIHRWAVDLG